MNQRAFMSVIPAVTIVVFSVSLFAAEVPLYQWAVSAGGRGDDAGLGMAVDPWGNILVTGQFTSPAMFGTNTLQDGIAFLAKYDGKGEVLSAIGIGTGTTAQNAGYGNYVAIDGAGSIYLAGSFRGTADFGTGPITVDHTSGFVGKWDISFNPVWIMGITSDGGGVYPYGLAVDQNGNSYLTGDIIGSTTFGNITVDFGESCCNAFLAKFDSTGDCLWVQSLGGWAGWSVAIGSSNNVFVTYWTDEEPTTAIASYSTDGTFLWTQNLGKCRGPLATDALGNVYAIGCSNGDLGWSNVSTNNDFVVKFNAQGNALWVLEGQFGPLEHGFSRTGTTLDPSGNLFLTGAFSGEGDFGSIRLTNKSAETFISAIGPDGQWLWVKQVQGRNSGASLATDRGGNLYVTGNYTAAQFDSTVLTNSGGNDVFLARIGNASVPARPGVVPTSPLPPLNVTLAGNSVLISWPASVTGGSLEQTDAVVGTGWNTVPVQPTFIGDQQLATVDISGKTTFFRLRK